MKLENKIALVTGAARGIGQQIAVHLARKKVKIIGHDIELSSLQETEGIVKKTGQDFWAVAGDISKENGVSNVVQFLKEEKIGIDILINNAGISSSGSFGDRDFQIWKRTVEVNLLGMMLVTHRLLPVLREKERAHIVNIASVAGKFGAEGLAAYSASKHGVVGFSSSLKAELEEEKIGVSWICPIYTKTRFLEKFQGNALTPILSPEAVAKATVKAIEKNRSEVFLPVSQKIWAGVLPILFPAFSRWFARRAKLSGNWREMNATPPEELGSQED